MPCSCPCLVQLTFDKETDIRKPEEAETTKKNPVLEKLDNRTLWEQLQANKEIAEEESKRKAALAFGALRSAARLHAGELAVVWSHNCAPGACVST